MMPVAQVLDWLESLPPTSSVGIDEGGLTLVEITKDRKRKNYELEVGGIPEDLE